MVKMKVTSVNAPKGTITVMWNDDPRMEWNYNIPFGNDSLPLYGEDLRMHLVAAVYSTLMQEKKVDETSWLAHDVELGKEYDVTDLFNEYDNIQSQS